jgi:hypothetical protein
MKIKIILTLVILCFIYIRSRCGLDNPFTFSGYVDVYYSDFRKPNNHTSRFMYNYNRSNEDKLECGPTCKRLNYSRKYSWKFCFDGGNLCRI